MDGDDSDDDEYLMLPAHLDAVEQAMDDDTQLADPLAASGALWTPLRVNNTNISGELPHSLGILMNTG